MAKLYFRYGAMNCGKTTHLLQVDHNYKEKGLKSIVIKPKIDSKGNNTITSRLGISREVDFLISKEDNLIELLKEEIDLPIYCLLVDEVQFLEPIQIDQLFEIAIIHNISVICYGLRTDFLMQGFKGSSRLLEIAHNIDEIKTICGCGKKAIINSRLVNGKYVFEGEQVVIDDNARVEYRAVCGECYLKVRNQ